MHPISFSAAAQCCRAVYGTLPPNGKPRLFSTAGQELLSLADIFGNLQDGAVDLVVSKGEVR
jgi:hypothetical protein